MGGVALTTTRALEYSCERWQSVGHVRERPWIKKGHPSCSPGTPVLGDFLAGCDAKLVQEVFGWDRPQGIFIENGDFSPFLRIVRLACVDTFELALVEGRAFCILEGYNFPLALDFLYLGARLGKR